MLFLAYTPRQPSIGTENMLRCAYRAGLTGEALLNDDKDGWKMGSVPDRTRQGVPRTRSSHRSEVYVCQDSIEEPRDPTHEREERQTAVDRHNRSTNNQHCGSLSHADCPKILPPQKVATTCRPVLLSFWLPSGVTGRRPTASTVNHNDAFSGSEALLPPPPGGTPVSLRESVWLSQWESVFPNLRHRKCGVRDVASESGKALAYRRRGGDTGEDAVSDEYLWGRSNVE